MEQVLPDEVQALRFVRGGCGYYTFELDSFRDFINEVIPRFPIVGDTVNALRADRCQYIWRGMRDPGWSLQSSLSRFASSAVKTEGEQWQLDVVRLTIEQLIEYMNGLRGLGHLTRDHDRLFAHLQHHRDSRSFHTLFFRDTPPDLRHLILDLFAHGQHHYLYTPFLDWSLAPAVALYFAFEETDSRPNGVGHRVVYALNQTLVEKICDPEIQHDADDVMFIHSMAHSNPRIVGQAGLFSYVPAHVPVNHWVVQRCENTEYRNKPVLLRFLIRNYQRNHCLEYLESCNVHARTLLPDQIGAAKYANYRSEATR